MSIVEKAAEKLRALQPEQRSTPPAETVPLRPAQTVEPKAPTVERLHERERVVDAPAPGAPPWPVDRAALRREGLLPADAEAARQLAHELRSIKRPLLGNAIGRGAKPLTHPGRIVVTSAVPNEGKTFTAVNLALSLAREPDFEVLLIDADIPKSDVTRVLGLDGHPGLMDLLVDEDRDPADVIVRTEVPDLMVVPVGTRHSLATEMFGSLRMQHVLAQLDGRNQRRLIVFDSSPLLATSESQVLASHMGQVVMVVAAGGTPQQTVRSAVNALEHESQYVGLLLNMARLPGSENHYDDYYGQYPGTSEGEA